MRDSSSLSRQAGRSRQLHASCEHTPQMTPSVCNAPPCISISERNKLTPHIRGMGTQRQQQAEILVQAGGPACVPGGWCGSTGCSLLLRQYRRVEEPSPRCSTASTIPSTTAPSHKYHYQGGLHVRGWLWRMQGARQGGSPGVDVFQRR